VDAAVLIPVKRFAHAKRRLGDVLDAGSRIRLARWLAGQVVRAAAPLPVFVACDDEDVAAWSDDAGANVLWSPGLGLNGAVDIGASTIAGKGFDHLVIAHSDLPLARHLSAVATAGTITLVPDRAGDGTNVLATPLAAPLRASYGPGSFAAHLESALATADRYRVEVRRDPALAIDVDTPDDLLHPAVVQELPAWLRTILANRS
jgi:2-phospho-L-lactate guanylyltransferase